MASVLQHPIRRPSKAVNFRYDSSLERNRRRSTQSCSRALRKQCVYREVHRDRSSSTHRCRQRTRTTFRSLPNLGVRTVVETHGHWDHIQAIPAIRDAGYEVGVAAQDATMLPSYDFILEDDSVIEIGRLRIRTIHNPGHTPGSMSFHVEDTPLLFSGDTLFPGGPGATDFEGGDFDTIIKSIDERMFSKFASDTVVLPGHGDDTTIGNEAPQLQEWADRGW